MEIVLDKIDVEWSSSDPNIADISSSGEVIAMIEGATEISASSNGISASKEIAYLILEEKYSVKCLRPAREVHAPPRSGV